MRNKLSDILYKRAKKDKKICVLVADISPAGSMDSFRNDFPERFVNTGVAEQSMIGIAAGMALAGLKPFCYTIATFSLYRPFEMIRVDLCYQNLPVTVVGMGVGTIYSTLGGTHLTQEDVSIARSLPNLKILSPCDPIEMEHCVNYCLKNKSGPIYLRIGKAGEKKINYKNSENWKFGKIRQIIKGEKICLISYGPIMQNVIELQNKIKKTINKEVAVYSFHTIKPVDYPGLSRIFKKYKEINVIEDNSEISGLSQIIKSFAYEKKYRGKINSYSLKDKFIHNYGTQIDLMEAHGINFKVIFNKIVKSII